MPASATTPRDLHDGTPVWRAFGKPRVPTLGLTDSIETDIVVMGAGISGALLADQLSVAGFKVVVVDRRAPCEGSTAASTALLQFEIDTPLTKLRRQIGRYKADRAWLRSLAAVNDLAARVRELRIDCAFKRRPALYLPGNILNVAELKREQVARAEIGLPSAMIDRHTLQDIAGIDRPCAIRSEGSAEVDPVRLAAGLLRRATARGVSIYAPLTVESVKPGDGVRLTTDTGRMISAKHLVFATGYELAKGVPKASHKIISTWAFATKPQRAKLWKDHALIWEAADPYLYIRTTVDGRVMVGGEDQEISDADERDALSTSKIATLQKKLAKLLPGIDPTPDYQWSGFFGESETGLPSIGAVPRMPNCYAVLGFGGNGITFSVIAAQIIQRQLCGIRDSDADLYAF